MGWVPFLRKSRRELVHNEYSIIMHSRFFSIKNQSDSVTEPNNSIFLNFSIDKPNPKWYNIFSSSFLNSILHRAETTAPFDPCPFAIATTHANDEQQSFTKSEKNKNYPNKIKQRKYEKK